MARRLAVTFVLALANLASAAVTLPTVFADHMVLQRERAAPVWGTADAGEAVSVRLGDQAPRTATADAAGKWRVNLPAQAAGGPFTLTVQGTNTLTVNDVYVGEVWLCSGQSNMEWVVNNSLNPDTEKAAATDPLIRCFTVRKATSGYSGPDVQGAWQVSSPDTVGGFTAAGYFMARELRRVLDVPVGLINSSWGGTRIEPWCTPASFGLLPSLASIDERVRLATPGDPSHTERLGAYVTELQAWLALAQAALADAQPVAAPPAYPTGLNSLASGDSPQQQPTTLYHAMIEGLVPYALRGAIWYQGESNHGEGMLYADKQEALVRGWRDVFENPDLAFNYVQIAPYNYGAEAPHILAEFWEAQEAALRVPNTGMVVTTDIADYNDIHPRNKQEVGRRLALLALRDTYGQDVVADGPVFRDLSQEGAQLRVRFDHTSDGLATRDGQAPDWFRIIGPGTDFEEAVAVIEGDSVLLSSPAVPRPVAVTFAWDKSAEPNLVNSAGLPARPFRAGTVPPRDFLALRVPEAQGWELVYDLDLGRLSASPEYTVDRHAQVTRPFDRVGYFIELTTGGKTDYVWVSADPFTTNTAHLGVPTVASGAVYQQRLTNVNVVTNAAGVTAGEGLTECNIEFWSHNYASGNRLGLPGANGTRYDFDDSYGEPVEGYGSMQMHNFGARQTLFAINNWRAGAGADLGIGNAPAPNEHPDWTFSGSARNYEAKRLRVLVRLAP